MFLIVSKPWALIFCVPDWVCNLNCVPRKKLVHSCLYYFLRFEIQARNDDHYTTNDKHYNKSVTKGKEKSSQTFLAAKILVVKENSHLDVAMEREMHQLQYTLSSLIFFTFGVTFIKATKTILIDSLDSILIDSFIKLYTSTWTFKFFRD